MDRLGGGHLTAASVQAEARVGMAGEVNEGLRDDAGLGEPGTYTIFWTPLENYKSTNTQLAMKANIDLE